jgi:diguanylate cyclase (GGDEF)-like protein
MNRVLLDLQGIMALRTPSLKLESLLADLRIDDLPFLSLAEVTSDAVLVADGRDLITMMNPRAAQWLGLNPREAIGRPIREVLPLLDLADAPTESESAPYATAPDDKFLLTNAHGAALPVTVSTKSLAGVSANHAGWHLYVVRDTHAAADGSAAADRLSDRRALVAALDRAIVDARRNQTTYSLLYVDVDQLEAINRLAGVAAGDRFLDRLRYVLLQHVPKGALLARIDGDAVALLLPDKDLDEAEMLARTLRRSLHATTDTAAEATASATISIGVALIDARSIDGDSALSEAQSACRRAFEDDGNRTLVVRTDSSGLQRKRAEIRWMARLSRAIDADDIAIYSRALAALDNSRQYPPHYEVQIELLDDESQQPFALDRLLVAADRFDLRRPLDRWLLSNLLPRLAALTAEGKLPRDSLHIVGLSEASIAEPAMLAFLRRRVIASGLQPERLLFRVAEPGASKNTLNAMRLLNGVRLLGCKVMLEGVGGTQSSFAYLKNLPADYLALDPSLAHGALTQRTDRAMIEAIQRLAEVLGLKTAAFDVGSTEAIQLLRELRVDFVQSAIVDAPKLICAASGKGGW